MYTLKIKGMNCSHCVANITKLLQSFANITNIQVDLAAGEAHFESQTPPNFPALKEAIEDLGFNVILPE